MARWQLLLLSRVRSLLSSTAACNTAVVELSPGLTVCSECGTVKNMQLACCQRQRLDRLPGLELAAAGIVRFVLSTWRTPAAANPSLSSQQWMSVCVACLVLFDVPRNI
jgi:hypothetical protein